MLQLSSTLEHIDIKPAAGTPGDEDIHPLQAQARKEDGEESSGYSEGMASEDAAER